MFLDIGVSGAGVFVCIGAMFIAAILLHSDGFETSVVKKRIADVCLVIAILSVGVAVGGFLVPLLRATFR